MMPLSADRPAGYRQPVPLSIRADGLIHLPGHGSCNLNDEFLRSMGIDPKSAIQELHVTIEDQKTVAERWYRKEYSALETLKGHHPSEGTPSIVDCHVIRFYFTP
ncbi:MAG: hypothetical protein R6V60_15040 [Desulfobacterales bacterium]